MDNKELQFKIAKNILIGHVILIGVICLFYFSYGFDNEEFAALTAALAPILGIYGNIAFKHLIGYKNNHEENENSEVIPFSCIHVSIPRLLSSRG